MKRRLGSGGGEEKQPEDIANPDQIMVNSLLELISIKGPSE